MRVTFLGTGTSHGVPMIGCDCVVCRSDDPRNHRLRPSICVETAGSTVLVDAPPDFRTQALRAKIRRVDAVLLTHTHADHILGLDDLRAFTIREGRKMPIFGSTESLKNIQRMFAYACTERPSWPTLPRFDLTRMDAGRDYEIAGVTVRAFQLPHGRMSVYGFLLGRELAYVTDCNAVPPEVVEQIRGVTVLVLDALRHRPHPTHLTVTDALEIARKVDAKLSLLTHICHELDHQNTENKLPSEVRVAYDGLQLDVNNGDWSRRDVSS